MILETLATNNKSTIGPTFYENIRKLAKKRDIMIFKKFTAFILSLFWAEVSLSQQAEPVDLFKGLGLLSPKLDLLIQNKTKNSVVSPLGIFQILCDLFLISDQPSKEEITKFLGTSITFEALSSFVKSLPLPLATSGSSDKSHGFYGGHFIFFSQGMAFNESRLEQLKQLSTEIIETDFTNPKKACDQVNQKVDLVTNHKIPDILKPEDLKGDKGSLVLLNTTYIKANWQDDFKSTKINFKTPKEAKKKDGFTGDVDLQYNQTPECTTLLLPGEESTFLIVRMTPDGALSPINDQEIKALFQKGKDENLIKLTMPNFTIENTLDLKKTLIQSLPHLLSEKSFVIDLYKELQPVAITTFLQKNKLEVNKDGIEGASASVMSLVPRMMIHEKNVKEITIDRPFSFAVIKKINDHQWFTVFTGHIVDP